MPIPTVRSAFPNAHPTTGRYVHQIGFWDNGHPYDGSVPSWHHHLRGQGYTCDSIGKLHFKGRESDHGFCREVEPLHVYDGTGDVLGCIRDSPPFRDKIGELVKTGGGGLDLLAARRALRRARAALAGRPPKRRQAVGRLSQLCLSTPTPTSHRQIFTSATRQPT